MPSETFPRQVSAAVAGAMALGLGVGLGLYAARSVRPDRIRYVQSHLESNAPFLGLSQDVKYEDGDGNGRLETYKKFPDAEGRFHRVVVNKDGSYELIPNNR